MKKIYGLFGLAAIIFMVACSGSDDAASGATTEGNTMTMLSLDSFMVYNGECDPERMDLTQYWFTINFLTEPELYFADLNDLGSNRVEIYKEENGVLSKGNCGLMTFRRTVVFMPDVEGYVANQKLDNFYSDANACERDLAAFDQKCKMMNGEFFDHDLGCLGLELHLSCSAALPAVFELADALQEYAADYAVGCDR